MILQGNFVCLFILIMPMPMGALPEMQKSKKINWLMTAAASSPPPLFFTSAFFTHCFTAVHPSLSLTVGFTVPCVVVVRSRRHHTHYHLHFQLTFTFPIHITIHIYINITIYIRFQLETVRYMFACCLVIVWF